jgi:hypothetical protein
MEPPVDDRTAYTIRHFSRSGALALHRLGVEVLNNQGPTYRYRRNGVDCHGSMSDLKDIADGRA